MGRPRSAKNAHLPVGVYFKSNAYYRIVHGRWIRLGTSPECVTLPPGTLPRNLSEAKRLLLAYCYKVLTRARQNAKGRRGIPFTLTRDEIHRLLNESGWRCAVTGTDFSMEVIGGQRPFAPSIDRRDNSKGYEVGNCRVVCVAVNYAMNVWGEEVLWRLFAKRGRKVLDNLRQLDDLAPQVADS